MAAIQDAEKVRSVFRTARSIDKKERARHLQQWAVNEMQIYRSVRRNAPSEADYQRMCSGNLGDIWEFVVYHVKSEEEVKKVHGNFNRTDMVSVYDDLHDSNETMLSLKEDMHKKMKERLLSDIKTAHNHICVIENTIADKRMMIAKLEEECFHISEEMDTCLHNMHLFREFDSANDRMAEKYQEMSNLLKEVLQHNPSSSQQSKHPFYVSQNAFGNTILETSCMRDVHLSTKAIQKFLFDVSRRNCSSDASTIRSRKKELLKQIFSICKENDVEDILKSLSEMLCQKSQMLKSKVYQLTDKRRFNPEATFPYQIKENFIKCQSVVAANILDMPTEQKLTLFTEFKKMLKYENRTAKLEAKKAALLEQIINKYNEMLLSGMEQSDKARLYLQSKADLAVIQASFNPLESVKSALRLSLKDGCDIKRNMGLKYSAIMKCQEILNEKIKVICIMKTRSNELRIGVKVQMNLELVTRNIQNRPMKCLKPLKYLKDCVVFRELSTFYQLPTSVMLKTVTLDRKLVLSAFLSVAIRGQFTGFNKSLSHALGQFLIQAPESILHTVSRFKEVETHFKTIRELQTTSLKEMLCEYDDDDDDDKNNDDNSAIDIHQTSRRHCDIKPERLKDLTIETRGRRQYQLFMLPELEKWIKELDTGFRQCDKWEELVLTWWKQPVESIVLPLTVKGMNLTQWRERMFTLLE